MTEPHRRTERDYEALFYLKDVRLSTLHLCCSMPAGMPPERRGAPAGAGRGRPVGEGDGHAR